MPVSAQTTPTSSSSLTLGLYAASMILPFVLALLVPRSTGMGIGLLMLLALFSLLTASVMLLIKKRWRGRGWLYPAGAAAAVVLFLLSAKPIHEAVDYLGFKFKQSHLEVLALNPNNSQQLAAAGIMRVETAQPGVLLFVEDGEASYQYWGVAYSAAGQKPSSPYLLHKLYYWQHLDGHWYKWARYDD